MSTHRRRISGRYEAMGGVVTAAVAGGGAFLFTGTAAPTSCVVDGGECSTDDGVTPDPPAARPTRPRRPRNPRPRPPPTASPARPPGEDTRAAAGFALYVDTSLYPAFDLVGTAEATGVKHYTLPFVTDGGGCTPKWGGVTDVGSDAVAAQIGDLRAKGGDVRVSSGGAAGSELGTTCASADALATAYGKAFAAYNRPGPHGSGPGRDALVPAAP